MFCVFFFVFFLYVDFYLRRSEPRRPLTGVDVVEAEVVAVAAAGRDVNSGRVALTPALLCLFRFV
jgi:hypothetical protein